MFAIANTHIFQICMTLFLYEIIGFNLYCGLNTFLTIAVMSDIDSQGVAAIASVSCP